MRASEKSSRALDWFASQDGNGAWAPLAADPDHLYYVPVNDPAGRFGVALVTSEQDNGEQEWHVKTNVLYSTLNETGLDLKVEQGQPGTEAVVLPEAPETEAIVPRTVLPKAKRAAISPASSATGFTVSGTVEGMNDATTAPPNGDTGSVYLTGESTVDLTLNAPYIINTVPSAGLYPVIAVKGNGLIPPEVHGGGGAIVEGPVNSAIDAILFSQVLIPPGSTLGVYNINFANARKPVDGAFHLQGIQPTELVASDVLLSTLRDTRITLGTMSATDIANLDYKGWTKPLRGSSIPVHCAICETQGRPLPWTPGAQAARPHGLCPWTPPGGTLDPLNAEP